MPPKFNSHGTVQIEFVQVYNALGGNEYSQKLTKKYINDKIKKPACIAPKTGLFVIMSFKRTTVLNVTSDRFRRRLDHFLNWMYKNASLSSLDHM